MTNYGNGQAPAFRLVLRDLPLPIRLTLSVFLLTVGAGYFSALVQLHFQHASRGNPLPTPDDVVVRFTGIEHFWSGNANGEADKDKAPPMCQLERLIMGPEEGLPFNGSGSMAAAFFKKDSDFKKKIKKNPQDEPKLRTEREGERLALQAWINAPADERKKGYEDNAFVLPESLVKRPLTEKYHAGKTVKVQSILEDRCSKCHNGEEGEGKADLSTFEALEKYLQIPKPVLGADGKMVVKSARQMSVERLAESTHVHALSFAVLFVLTGLVFALSSYPAWMRCVLAPLVLTAQVVDLSCWWLARLDGIGPYFALAIMGTGSRGRGLDPANCPESVQYVPLAGQARAVLAFRVRGRGRRFPPAASQGVFGARNSQNLHGEIGKLPEPAA